jgi:hypothetical protein
MDVKAGAQYYVEVSTFTYWGMPPHLMETDQAAAGHEIEACEPR